MKEAVAMILINNLTQCLMLLRDDNDSIAFPNHWDFIGGRIELKESPFEAMKREFVEELGIPAPKFDIFKKYIWPDKIEFVYVCNTEIDVKSIKLGEGQQIAYFHIDDLLRNKLAFYDETILKDFFNL